MSYRRETPESGRSRALVPGGGLRLSLSVAVVSLLCGILLFSLFRFFTRAETGRRIAGRGAGCVVLAADESRDDSSIRESLARGGMEGFISESSQEVPIDDFGALRMIPLESFRDEVESFDPRDTGYAAKLRAFFVRDGKRFFFLPLDDTSGYSAAKLKKRVAFLLGDIPFSLSVLGRRSSFFWYFALLAAASCGVLYFSRARRLFVYELPVLFAFGWGGVSAFVLAALLAGIWELLREPLLELSAGRRYEQKFLDYAGEGFGGLKERLKPFRINCLLALVLLFVFAFFSVFAKLPPVPLIAGCFCFFFVYFLAFRAETKRIRKSRHIPFIPVPLLPFRLKTFSLNPLLLPFAAASVLVVFISPLFPGLPAATEGDFIIDNEYLVSPADYHRYIDFQKSFSLRPLDSVMNGNNSGGPGEPLNQERYLRYYLGDDGLIAGSTDYAAPGDREAEDSRIGDPPFPLEKLMDFLVNYREEAPAMGMTDSLVFDLKEWIPAAIILTVCMLNSLNSLRPVIRSRRKRVPVLRDKRIAA